MKHTVTFFPVGNGDTSLIQLDNKKWILTDYYHQSQGEDPNNTIIDLKRKLTDMLRLAKKTSFDVVMFTHADKDHIQGSSDFFYFEHAAKYQAVERPKIDELWVPAAFVLEEGLEDDDRVIRQEARYRLEKKGTGIKIFSKPEELKDWLEKRGLTVEDRRGCFVDAGQLVSTFTAATDGLELFCHAPFKEQVDDHEEYRNNASIILHATFCFPSVDYKYFMIGDADWDYLEKVVTKTETNRNEARLSWDLYFAPHHCSYKGLSDEKGDYETIPTNTLARLLNYGRQHNFIVASCFAFETIENPTDRALPPHIQAKKCYERFSKSTGGRKIFITMSYPNYKDPKPLSIEIDENGLSIKDSTPTPILTSAPPRAGSNGF